VDVPAAGLVQAVPLGTDAFESVGAAATSARERRHARFGDKARDARRREAANGDPTVPGPSPRIACAHLLTAGFQTPVASARRINVSRHGCRVRLDHRAVLESRIGAGPADAGACGLGLHVALSSLREHRRAFVSAPGISQRPRNSE
jgi:hypothetical protein